MHCDDHQVWNCGHSRCAADRRTRTEYLGTAAAPTPTSPFAPDPPVDTWADSGPAGSDGSGSGGE